MGVIWTEGGGSWCLVVFHASSLCLWWGLLARLARALTSLWRGIFPWDGMIITPRANWEFSHFINTGFNSRNHDSVCSRVCHFMVSNINLCADLISVHLKLHSEVFIVSGTAAAHSHHTYIVWTCAYINRYYWQKHRPVTGLTCWQLMFLQTTFVGVVHHSDICTKCVITHAYCMFLTWFIWRRWRWWWC